jgi:hypothetical protein
MVAPGQPAINQFAAASVQAEPSKGSGEGRPAHAQRFCCSAFAVAIYETSNALSRLLVNRISSTIRSLLHAGPPCPALRIRQTALAS